MHIFITGGTRGIGNGLVKVFLKKGYQVSFTGTSDVSISQATKELSGNFKAYICDVRKRSQIEETKKKAVDLFGNIDIWINNAGIDQPRNDFSDLSQTEVKKVIDVNVLGTMNGTNIALNQMKEQGYGIIYNLEGLGSNNMVIPKTIVYGSTKRLITYFCKGCNKELKEYKNIYVGTIQPGMVFTDLLMNNMNEEGMKIANILGNEVDYVANIVVNKILKGKKKIKVMNNFQVMGRFIRSIFIKNRRKKF